MLEKAKAHLQTLKKMGLQAHIAGGFVRDLLNDIEPKDIDIFVTGSGGSYNLTTVNQINHNFTGKWYVNYGDGAVRDDVQSIVKVGEDLDIIFMHDYMPSRNHPLCFEDYTILDTVLNFDVSICGCYAELNEDGDLDVYVTEDYMDWVNGGVVYRYTDIPTSDNHLARIINKYKTPLTMKHIDRNMPFIKYKTI